MRIIGHHKFLKEGLISGFGNGLFLVSVKYRDTCMKNYTPLLMLTKCMEKMRKRNRTRKSK